MTISEIRKTGEEAPPTLMGIIKHLVEATGTPNFGLSLSLAKRHGYKGPIENITLALAQCVYYNEYISVPRFDRVFHLSEKIGYAVIRAGIDHDIGTSSVSIMLQRSLNAFNGGGRYFSYAIADGKVGEETLLALEEFLKRRGEDGETVLLNCISCLKGEYYLDMAERNQKHESQVFNWFLNIGDSRATGSRRQDPE